MMNADKTKDELIDGILKEAQSEIRPSDSWEALRTRIDERLAGNNVSGHVRQLRRNAVFWRRIAVALAACLTIISILFIFTLRKADRFRPQLIDSSHPDLLSRAQLIQLNTAFTHVCQLFEQNSPWMVVDSGGEGEIGVDSRVMKEMNANKIVVVRLAVHFEGRKAGHQYYDVVTFSDRHVSFRTSVAEGPAMEISLKPVLTNAGKIEVEINAQIDNGSQAGETVTIANDSFTSLVRLRANGSWININAVGMPACNI